MQPESGRLRVVDGPDAPEDLPSLDSGDGQPSPGGYIRDQRQRQGVSLDQLAAATKIPRSSLAILEDDRYDELPGPVFVKGFLRCAARSLGLDPEVVLELLYEQERQALHAKRRERSAPVPVAEPPAEPAVKRLPPRVAKSAEATVPSVSVLRRLVESLPAATTLLWVIVVAVLAMIVMAAFNLMGTVGGSAAT